MKTYQEVISGKYFSLEEREPHDPDGGEIMKIIITYKEEKPRSTGAFYFAAVGKSRGIKKI